MNISFRHHLSLRLVLTLLASALAIQTFAQSVGDFRSIASGNWNALTTWERFDGASWVGNFFPTNANAGVITIQSPHMVTNTASVSADQVVVAAGATLVASAGNFTAAAGAGTDLDISGTFLVLSGSSALTIASGASVVVESGGVFIHNGSSGACVNNAGGVLQFAATGKFQLQRAGGTIPIATWNAGSICEIAYATASTSRPGK